MAITEHLTQYRGIDMKIQEMFRDDIDRKINGVVKVDQDTNDVLIQELKDDKLCGFTGKTVIHPNQISVVNKVYQVTRSDFNDAKAILNWYKKSDSLVSGNLAGERMNEYKTHHNWAEKILFLAEVFGITD